MPTLFRFLSIVAILGGIAYGGIWALATFVQPEQREMKVNVPASSFAK